MLTKIITTVDTGTFPIAIYSGSFKNVIQKWQGTNEK